MTDWEPYREDLYGRLYGEEARCYEVRLVGTDRVANLDKCQHFVYSTSKGHNPFNLSFEIRKIKNYTPRKPKVPDKKTHEEVLSEYYDKDTGVLLEMEREIRYVYENSKGRYIMTRGSGRIFLTSDNPAYIRYMCRGYQTWAVPASEYEQVLTQVT